MIKNCLSATSIVALTLTMSVSTQVFAAVANFGSYGVNGREVAAPSWKRGVHDGPWPEPVRRADVGLWQTCCGLTIQERVLTQRKRPRPLAKMAFFRRAGGRRRGALDSSATLLDALRAIPIAIIPAVGLINVVWSQKPQSPTAGNLPSVS